MTAPTRAQALLARGYTPERVAQILAAHGTPVPRCEQCEAPILPPSKPLGGANGCWCEPCATSPRR